MFNLIVQKKMKKITFAIYICLLHLFLAILFLKPDLLSKTYDKIGFRKHDEGHEYYQEFMWQTFVERSKTLDKDSRQIIFFGNSITNGLCVESLFQGINMGVSGETLFKAKERIKNIQNLENKKIVLAYGINDIPKNNQAILEDYKELINNLPSSASIFISSVLPLDEEVYSRQWKTKKTNQQISQLNQLLEIYCQDKANIQFLDSSKYLFNSSGNLDQKLHSGDGIHLNKDGRILWAKGLMEGLDEEASELTSKEEI